MGHRIAPDPLVDLLASQDAVGLCEQVQDLELPGGQLETARVRIRLVEVRPDRDLADHERALELWHLVAPVAADRRLDDADQFLGVTRLAHPGVRPEAQPADALTHRRGARADHDREAGKPGADPLQILPAAGPEHGDVEHQRVQPHRDERVRGHRRRQRAVLPAQRVETIRQHLQEPGVAVDDREPKATADALWRLCARSRVAGLGRHERECKGSGRTLWPCRGLGNRFFTRKERQFWPRMPPRRGGRAAAAATSGRRPDADPR